MRDVYKETRLRVTCYMAKSTNEWIKVAWNRKALKNESSIIDEVVATMAQLGADIQFEDNAAKLGGEQIDAEWRLTWKKIKESFKKGTRSKRIENYKNKEQQSKLFAEQEQECNLWLSQNLDPRKTTSILTMIEQMVETRAWKAARGPIEDGRCRICFNHGETVEHLVAGCRVLLNSEYLTRHNRALMILAVAWAKEYELIGEDTVWYKERWERGTVLENVKAKLVWDFEFNLQKTNTSRRPDLILEDKESKKIWIVIWPVPNSKTLKQNDRKSWRRIHN